MITPTEAGVRLREWMRAQGLSEVKLVQHLALAKPPIQVSQPWVSRVLDGKFSRFTGKAAAMLAFASIRINTDGGKTQDGRSIIEDALDEAWDGSVEEAAAIAALLRSVARLRRRGGTGRSRRARGKKVSAGPTG